ncbi:MAG: chorismate synthase, partial [bacterium]|nr:chorismate synthase [bacterium]
MALRFLSAGESHGPCLTVIVEGVPAGLPLTEEMIAQDLARRQLKAGAGGRMVIETDHADILAGVMDGKTTGAPIALRITNRDHESWENKAIPAYTTARPGHADLAACVKYGYNDIRIALERSSARETACRVAAGAIARAFLRTFGIEVDSVVSSIGDIPETETPLEEALVFAACSPLRAPNEAAEVAYSEIIRKAKKEGDTLGGILTLVA